eukprot:TRINITY_DN11102_c0_g1_i1.p1 TRINITY_DN11102_c0_g1~~TRINITY_DN11102_c0_g1_i1.p1  ORF type:complete len:314 (+),score=21.69 TRINITY_DN11102_c0_g1_i1:84-1025(+)
MSNMSYYDCPPGDSNCTVCALRYTGDQCDIDVFDNDYFVVALALYSIVFCFLWIVVLVVLSYLIYDNIHVWKKSPKVIAMWPGYVLFPAIFIRIISFIDPNGVRMVFNSNYFIILIIYLPGVFVYGSSILTISVWLDVLVGIGKKYKADTNFTTPKIISAVFAFGILSALIFILVIFFNDPLNLAFAANILIAVCGVLMLVFLGAYLPFVHCKFSDSQLKKNVRRIEAGLVACSCVLLYAAVIMVSLMIMREMISTHESRFIFYYFLIQSGARIAELGVVVCVMYSTLHNPKGDKQSTTRLTSNTANSVNYTK